MRYSKLDLAIRDMVDELRKGRYPLEDMFIAKWNLTHAELKEILLVLADGLDTIINMREEAYAQMEMNGEQFVSADPPF